MRKSVQLNLLLIRLKNNYFSQQQFLILLSILVGFTAGLVAVVLKNLSFFIQQLLTGKYLATYHFSYYFIFPLLGLALVYAIVHFIYKRQVGQGIAVTLFSISRKKGILDRFQSYASLLTAPITIGFGGSVGMEAPTVVTGASLGSSLSRYFKMNQAARTLLIGCAAAAAMSSIFKAPIAGIIFAIEIFSLDLTLASMIPLLTASVSAILTSYFFFGNDIILHTILEDEFDVADVPFYVLLGMFSALVSVYFSKVYFSIFKGFKKLKNNFSRMLLGGVVLGILIYLAPALYGEGYEVINALLQQNYQSALGNQFFNDKLTQPYYIILFLVLVFIFKSIATSVTIAAGGVGGIFAPVLFMGSAMGNAFAQVVNTLGIKQLSVTNFTLVGMAGLMAGIMHAPLTAIFLIAEITSGYELFIPLMITAGISFFVTSQFEPHSVYTIELAQRGDLLTHNKDQNVLTLMDIRQEIETNFIALNEEMNLGEIVEVGVIHSSRNIFPVVDKQLQFKGIILLNDIRTIMFDKSLYQEVKVTDVMQQAPEVIDLDNCTMKDILQKFEQTNTWNLPVVQNGVYKGFVSKSKLLTAYRQKLIDLSV